MLFKGVMILTILLCSSGIGRIYADKRGAYIRTAKALQQGCRVAAEDMALYAHTLQQGLQAAYTATGLKAFAPGAEQDGWIEDVQAAEIFGDFLRRLRNACTAEQLQAAGKTAAMQFDRYLETQAALQKGKDKVVQAVSVSAGLALAVLLL